MEFDDEWINNFKLVSKRLIKIFYCYVDKDNTLHKINQEVIEVRNNIIKRDELVRLIISNKKRHQLLNILCYNTGEINDNTNFKDFMISSKIEDIKFQETHKALEGTDSIFLFFKEFSKKLKSNGTKKVCISSSRNTRRKRLKANTTEV